MRATERSRRAPTLSIRHGKCRSRASCIGAILPALLVLPDASAAGRDFPAGLNLSAVTRSVAPCGVTLMSTTPNMLTPAQEARGRHRGNALFEGHGPDLDRSGSPFIHNVSVSLDLRRHRVVRLDFEAPEGDSFQRCGRHLVELAFPWWPGLHGWLDRAVSIPRPAAPALERPGPQRQAVQDDLYVTVWGPTFRLVSGWFDRTELGGPLQPEDAYRVERRLMSCQLVNQRGGRSAPCVGSGRLNDIRGAPRHRAERG